MRPLRYEPIDSQEDQPHQQQTQQLPHRNNPNKLLQIFVIILLVGVCVKMFYGTRTTGGVIRHPASNNNKPINSNSQHKTQISVHKKYQTQSDMQSVYNLLSSNLNMIKESQLSPFVPSKTASKLPVYHQPAAYPGISKLMFQQMPICLITRVQTAPSTTPKIYSNYLEIFIYMNESQSLKLPSFEIGNSLSHPRFHISGKNIKTVDQYNSLINTLCMPNSIVMLAPQTISYNLSNINELYHKNRIYSTLTDHEGFLTIDTFYLQLWNRVLREVPGVQWEGIALAMLQLTNKKNIKVPPLTPLTASQTAIQTSLPSLLSVSYSSPPKGYSFHFLNTLSSYRSIVQFEKKLSQISRSKEPIMSPTFSQVSKDQMMRSFQYEETLFFPKEHVLNKRQWTLLYNAHGYYKYENYPIDRSTEGEDIFETQTQLCVVYVGEPHTDQTMHINSLKSVLRQNYTNYKLIYIDNGISQKKYAEIYPLLLEKKSISIKNMVRQSRIYNYLMASNLFCGENSKIILISSESQIIGPNFFRLFDWVWTMDQEIRLLYTGFKKRNDLSLGKTRRINYERQLRGFDGRKQNQGGMGEVIGVSRDVIRSLPESYFKQSEKWIENGTRWSLFYALAERSTPAHMHYLPTISYTYDAPQGELTDSPSKFVLQHSPLDPFFSPSSQLAINENKKLSEKFKQDENKVYRIINDI